MMTNLKQRCAVCKKELLYFKMVLMMGPRGFRRYAVCDACKAKMEPPSPALPPNASTAFRGRGSKIKEVENG
jgi:hypothetical protein